MSYGINDHGIVSGEIQYPAHGLWIMDAELDTDEEVTGLVTVHLPGVDLVGTVIDGGVSFGRQHLRILGGRAGLRKRIPGQPFRKANVRTIVKAILLPGGEKLSADCDESFLNRELQHWTHIAGSGGEALDKLCDHLKANWNVRPDGSIWIGVIGWEDGEVEHELCEEDLKNRSAEVFTLEQVVMPGTTFRGYKIGAVEHTIRGNKARTQVHWGCVRDPYDEDLEAVVRLYAPTGKSQTRWEGKIVAVHSDWTVDVEPADEAIGPGWQHLEVALQGLFKVKAIDGARCIVDFLDANREKPVVTQFLLLPSGEAPAFAEAVMQSGTAAARNGDAVNAGTLTGTVTIGPTTAPVQFIYTSAGGAAGGAGPTAAMTGGKITGGSDVVKKVS